MYFNSIPRITLDFNLNSQPINAIMLGMGLNQNLGMIKVYSMPAILKRENNQGYSINRKLVVAYMGNGLIGFKCTLLLY